MKKFNYIILLIIFSIHSLAQVNESPLLKIGILADAQYADKEKIGNRDYRGALPRLKKCIDIFNDHNLSFIANLGDLIDEDFHSFDLPLDVFSKAKAKTYHVIGNHDFSVDDKYKNKIRKLLNNKKGYFDFKINSFVFIVLDGTDISTFSVKENSPKYHEALAISEEIKNKGGNNSYTWNGGIGEKQLKWLEKRLLKADESNQKVIIFCHWPLLPENGAQLWNNRELLNVINKHTSVTSWISGHHHAGHYEKTGGINHFTIKGIIEAQAETSCGILEVYSDKLKLIGFGDQNNQELDFYNN